MESVHSFKQIFNSSNSPKTNFLCPATLHDLRESEEVGSSRPLLMTRFLKDNLELMTQATSYQPDRERDGFEITENPGNLQESDTEKSDQMLDTGIHSGGVRSPVIDYNLILIGDCGLGKTSFLSAFLKLKSGGTSSILLSPHSVLEPSSQAIQRHFCVLPLSAMTLRLDLIDTPGYGQFDSFFAWQTMLETFITEQAVSYYEQKQEGSKTQRTDTRVHLCLYFLDGNRIKEKDLKVLDSLQHMVNLVLIISKCDSMTPTEILSAKLSAIETCHFAGIHLFDCSENAPEWTAVLNEAPLGPCPPFALLSHCDSIQLSDGKSVFGRAYRWGICDIENPAHSDFSLLSSLLVNQFPLPSIKATKALARNLAVLHARKLREMREVWQRRSASRSWVTSAVSGLLHLIGK